MASGLVLRLRVVGAGFLALRVRGRAMTNHARRPKECAKEKKKNRQRKTQESRRSKEASRTRSRGSGLDFLCLAFSVELGGTKGERRRVRP